jgi:hypothetical protein
VVENFPFIVEHSNVIIVKFHRNRNKIVELKFMILPVYNLLTIEWARKVNKDHFFLCFLTQDHTETTPQQLDLAYLRSFQGDVPNSMLEF